MLHCILVKWKDGEGEERSRQAELLFQQGTALPGVKWIKTRRAVISGPNRCDLMICIEMERQDLAAFDASRLHQRWKDEFGPCIQQKTIFDCEA